MLPAAVTNLNTSVSYHSRNAYNTWKKSKSTFSLNLTNRKTTRANISARRSYTSYQNNSILNCKKHGYGTMLCNKFGITSVRYVYLLVRSKCTQCVQSAIFVQKRHVSGKHMWKKTIKRVFYNLQNNFLLHIKPSFAGGLYKTKLKPVDQATSTSHNVFNIPYLFMNESATKQKQIPSATETSEEEDKESANNSMPLKEKLETKTPMNDEVLPSSNDEEKNPEHSEHNEDKIKENSGAVEKDNINLQNSSFDQSAKTTPHKRSQYEHLATSLSRQKEAEKNGDESSLFNSVKSYVETPMNSFFSFLSRATQFEILSSQKSEEKEGKTLTVSDPSDAANKEDAVTTPPPTVLEYLYQYIPYGFSPTPEQKKEEKEQMETAKLKAEKELLLQKVNINNRTRYLIHAIQDSNSLFTTCQLVDELKDHLLRFPDTRITAVKENAIKEIMHIYRTTLDKELATSLRMTLAMLGQVDPPKQRGIRVLCIDGGGSRGVASVEILREVVQLTGRPINELFDYICGVSTGAVLAFLLGILKLPIEEVGPMYRELSSEIFSRNRLVGTGNLVLSHAYYDTETYQKVLRNILGDKLLIETAAYEDVPKCSAVSTLVNRLPLKPFLWRNYSIVPGTRHTHWNGTCRATMWEAVRASSAAPGYFEEFKKGYNIHQDGGVLTNNPTGVALNECRLLWPNAPIQCVVSVGTGRYEPTVGPIGEEFSSIKEKFQKFVDSATSVTEVHTVMHDLLPSGTYFRFNPFIDEPILLDECRPEKMELLVRNTMSYIEHNEYKFNSCADVLVGQRVKQNKAKSSWV